MNGVKISLEGIDGVGKTTQFQLLNKRFADEGQNAYFKPDRNSLDSRDLDNEILGLIKSNQSKLQKYADSDVLLQAARAGFIHNTKIREKLKEGGIIICDRDIDTAVAYSMPNLQDQFPDKRPMELVRWIESLQSLSGYIPDLTILLHADLAIALNRATDDDKPNSNERAVFTDNGRKYLKRVMGYYSMLAALHSDRIVSIDVNNKSITDVRKVVDFYVDKQIKKSQNT